MIDISRHLPNLLEFNRALAPGDRLGANELLILMVQKLECVCTIAGVPRPVHVAVHEKNGLGQMVSLFVVVA